MFTTVSSAAALIEAGQLRALAVTSAERSPAFPQLPTVAEAGVPGYVLENWYGLFAPARRRLRSSTGSTVPLAKPCSPRLSGRSQRNEGLVMVAGAAGGIRALFPRAKRSAGAR